MASTAFAVFSKVGNVCCFWDVRYPGPVERQGKGQASRRDGEAGQGRGQLPAEGPGVGGGTAASGRDDQGDKGSHGLGSTAVLDRPRWGRTAVGSLGAPFPAPVAQILPAHRARLAWAATELFLRQPSQRPHGQSSFSPLKSHQQGS